MAGPTGSLDGRTRSTGARPRPGAVPRSITGAPDSEHAAWRPSLSRDPPCAAQLGTQGDGDVPLAASAPQGDGDAPLAASAESCHRPWRPKVPREMPPEGGCLNLRHECAAGTCRQTFPPQSGTGTWRQLSPQEDAATIWHRTLAPAVAAGRCRHNLAPELGARHRRRNVPPEQGRNLPPGTGGGPLGPRASAGGYARLRGGG